MVVKSHHRGDFRPNFPLRPTVNPQSLAAMTPSLSEGIKCPPPPAPRPPPPSVASAYQAATRSAARKRRLSWLRPRTHHPATHRRLRTQRCRRTGGGMDDVGRASGDIRGCWRRRAGSRTGSLRHADDAGLDGSLADELPRAGRRTSFWDRTLEVVRASHCYAFSLAMPTVLRHVFD